jgi:hypothetical protein
MSDLERLVATVVDRHRPEHQPSFEALVARWRRRRLVRRGSTMAAVFLVAAAAVAVPVALLDRSGETLPAATGAPSPRPVGRIPWDVTAVTVCDGTECRTVTDPHHLGVLVDDLNASPPVPYEMNCDFSAPITLTFGGPNEPYPVVEVRDLCPWWSVRGEAERYKSVSRKGPSLSDVRLNALQALRLGVVVHDCQVSFPYIGPTSPASEFVGLTVDEARSVAAQRGLSIRVRGEDGTCAPEPTLEDLHPDRVNLYVEHGRVVTANRY